MSQIPRMPAMPVLPRQPDAPEDPKETRRWRRRTRLLQIVLLGCFGIVCLRLVQIQIVDSARFAAAARDQYEHLVRLPAARGSITDRNGLPIASSTMFVSVEADPRNVGPQAAALASSLSKITGKPARYYLDRLRKGMKARYAVLERALNPQAVMAAKLDTLRGVTLNDRPERVYHTGIVAGQLIGMTGDTNGGVAGVELGYDTVLSGESGYVMYQKDGRGKLMRSVDYPHQEPVPGNTVVLTIDLLLQQIAESELEAGVKENGAEGGIVVMLDPRTGEVLALAQYPRVNPEDFGDASKENQKLRAITDMVEPGSVFKIVTAGAAIDQGLVSPERRFFAENGEYRVRIPGRKAPRLIKDVHRYGYITFRESMEYSSNIVMAKVSDILGNELLYRTARDFGFGMKTGVDIPGEIGGRLYKPAQWTAPTRNSMAYGYEVGVTPIQVAAAYAAVANGGVLMKPFILMKEIDPEGNTVREAEPAPVRRVVSEETAATLTSFFEGVVERGTATSAKIAGVRIAGKTGTSKRLTNGRYEGSEYTASFVGYFPADHPEVVCLVMLDKPKGISYYGGTTSAPIFREIVKRIVSSSDRYAIPVASVSAGAGGDGRSGAGEIPAEQVKETGPEPRRTAARAVPPTADGPRHIVPDVRGLSRRKAISLLKDERFRPVVQGSGVVVSQTPRPGEPVSDGRVIRLTCQPRTAVSGGER